MTVITKATDKPLDSTPPRPEHPLAPPKCSLTFGVDVDTAHLANPLIAIARLLANEAQAFACVSGDESYVEISVALPDESPGTRASAEQWIRWVIHNAGVRGHVFRVDRT